MATLLRSPFQNNTITKTMERTPLKVESSLSVATNNIVKLSSRSKNEVVRVENEFKTFSTFLETKIQELLSQKLPDRIRIQRLSNLNLVDTFGTPGGLLTSLASGALDVAGLLGDMFPGKGRKMGTPPGDISKTPKPTPKGSRIRFGGVRALPILNTIFTGLDFATGLASGESVGKAAAGAGGSLAGSLLGGAIGQALIPVPGLGFIIGSAAGSFLGGFAGDRAYGAVSGEEKTQEEKASEFVKKRLEEDRSKKERESKLKPAVSTFKTSVEEFDKSTTSFEEFVKDILSGKINLFTAPKTGTKGGAKGGGAPGEETVGGGGEVPTTPEGLPALPPTNLLPGQAYGAPRDGGRRRHAGQDFDISGDEKFYSRLGGEVIFAGNVGGEYGNIVEIYNKDLNKTESIAEANHIMPNIKVGMVIAPGTPVVWGERTVATPGGSVGVIHYEISSGRGGIGLGIHNTHESPLNFLNSKTYQDYIKTKTRQSTSTPPTPKPTTVSPAPPSPTPSMGPRSSTATPSSTNIASAAKANIQTLNIPGSTQVVGSPSQQSAAPVIAMAPQRSSSVSPMVEFPINPDIAFGKILIERKLELFA